MNVEEMKQMKKEKGYSCAQIAELASLPLGTVQKIFSGETQSPRYDTLLALESVFCEAEVVRERAQYTTAKQGEFTLEDYYALPEDMRAELIDGKLYAMASPRVNHQKIIGEFHRQVANYIMENGGDCEVLLSPVDVQLDCDNRTMLVPDLVIVCKGEKVLPKNVYGAPDFVLEVTSVSTRKRDYTIKLGKYAAAGVREYWIVDMSHKKILVYDFEGDVAPTIYEPEGAIPVRIYDGKLQIQMKHIGIWIKAE